MRFSDFEWRVVSPEPAVAARAATITIGRRRSSKANTAYLAINAQVRKALGINRHIELLINGKAIAIRPATATSPTARRVTTKNEVPISRLGIDVLRLAPGERYALPVTVEEGHAWALLPDELVRRMREGRAA